MPTGTVKWYNPEKGFGFIERDSGGDDLFVHRSAIGYQALGEGDRVEFREGQGAKGPSAEDVVVLESNPNPRPRRGGAPTIDPMSLPVASGVVDRFDDLKGFGANGGSASSWIANCCSDLQGYIGELVSQLEAACSSIGTQMDNSIKSYTGADSDNSNDVNNAGSGLPSDGRGA